MTTGEGAAERSMADVAMRALLARHPDALVIAIQEDARSIPMPDTVPLTKHRIPQFRSALDLVHPSHRASVIGAWERTLARGGGRVPVVLAGDASSRAVAHFFDVRDVHGALIGVVIPTEGGDVAIDEIAERPLQPPRFVRTRKNEVSLFLEVGPEITGMLGWAPEELLGRRSLEFIHPDDHEVATDTWMEALGHPGATVRSRLRHQHKDGRWIWLELANRNMFDDPEHGCMDCEMLDISEEMTAVEAVRASEQLLRRLAEALPVGVVQFGLDLHIVFANDELFEIVGASPGDPEGILRECVRDLGSLREGLQRVLRGDDVDLDIQIDRRNGTGSRHCAMALRALTSAEGEVTGAVGCLTDVTDSSRLRTELERRAMFDPLTGCVNRAVALGTLAEALGDRRKGTATMFLDLDGFKSINDRFGHGVGDTVLVTVAARLRDAVRGGDTVGRIGGDEFLVICPDVDDRASALALAERITTLVRGPLDVTPDRVEIEPSVGVAWVGGGDITSAEALVASADEAMYHSKRTGDGRPVLAGMGAGRVATRPDVGSRLRRALADGELELHFQEIVTIADQRIVGSEALLRWRRDGELLPAGAFIADAEATGVICDIGMWGIDEVCRLAVASRRPDLRWFVNLSPRELASPRVLAAAGDALERHGLDPASLVIELTEHAALVDGGAASRAVAQLASWGIGVALDDFGTGWSSLASLLAVPASWIKIDRTFITAAPASATARGIIGGIVDLAARVGAEVVAEGIEVPQELAIMTDLGVGHAQGYHFSRPRPLDDLLAAAPAT